MKIKSKITRIILCVLAILIVLGALYWAYNKYLSRTRIAFINFQVMTLGEINKANDNPMIKLEELPLDEVNRIDDYDMVFVNGMGMRITEEQREAIQLASWMGTNILTTMSTNPDNFIVSVDSITADTLNAYLRGGTRQNYRSMLNYIRTHVDKKVIFKGEVDSVMPPLSGLLSHPNLDDPDEEDVYFESVAEYDAYLAKHDKLKQDAPRIVITGAMGDPKDLMLKLEEKGYVPYRVDGLLKKFMSHIDSVQPAAMINFAHGRLGDYAVDYLKAKNIPLFCPINVNTLDTDWLDDNQGMIGGFLSQSVVTPELDGALRPYVLFAQRINTEGLHEGYTIPERLEKFVETIDKYVALKHKKNQDKKVAIVYFKGPGEESLVASGLDVVPSLYNVLLRMRAEGYNVKGLPISAAALAEQFQRQPRTVYGNVALVMQPLAAEGENDFEIIHGVDQDPIEEFQQAYYWIQDEFKADMLIHFGTHGGLEYTPRKQVALSSNDWPDKLVGTLPHYYIYTIGNVGEALIAKRRTYAGIQSHLTAPYLESGLRGQYKELSDAVDAYNKAAADDPMGTAAKKASLKVKKLAVGMGIHRDLNLDSILTEPWNETQVAKIEQFGEELANEKIVGQFYTLGVPYEAARIESSIYAMATDPIAYSLLALDKQLGRTKGDTEKHKALFTQKYIVPARALVGRLLAKPNIATDAFICQTAGITMEQLEKAREIDKSVNSGDDLMAMMMEMGEMMQDHSSKGEKPAEQTESSQKKVDAAKPMDMPAGHPKMGDGEMPKDPKTALRMAKMAGASPEALKKMAAAMGLGGKSTGGNNDRISGMMSKMAQMRKTYSPEETYLANAIMEVERTLKNVGLYKSQLLEAPEVEMASLMNAMNGGYTAPSSGGDIISNPRALPTGRNLYGINAENTPSAKAWDKGKALVDQTIALYRERHNDSIPRKVSFTFWSSEFIETEGVTIAQALYMLGVEPIRDTFGRVTDIRLIPSEELGRPRIDVVVQTSGQFRDLAASRLYLINRAVQMAAAAAGDKYANMVHAGVVASERVLTESGISPKEAREMSTFRIFGGVNGGYGTGIQDMVQQGDSWQTEDEIAETYINNMSAFYGTEEYWEKASKVALKAALTNTDAVIQPRQSNSWGALSLDHVYEFMGGMNLAVRNVTGKDPDAYLADYRNRNNNRMQDVKEAIGVESRATIFNQVYIKEKMKGGANEAGSFAEIVENTYGWNVMKPQAIDNEMWDQIYETYIEDKMNLGVDKFLKEQNPAAMQSMTHSMLQSAEKGLWKTSPERLKQLQELDQQLQQESEARQRERLNDAEQIEQQSGTVMKKETLNEQAETETTYVTPLVVIGIVAIAAVMILVLVRKRRGQNEE